MEPSYSAAFGDFVGFNVGILGWAVTVIAWAAMLAGFAKIFIITFPAFEGYNLPISIGMLILLSLMNIAGLKTSKMFTLTATVAKLIPIVLFSLFAIFFIPGGVSSATSTPLNCGAQDLVQSINAFSYCLSVREWIVILDDSAIYPFQKPNVL